jgi:hypothetical protein
VRKIYGSLKEEEEEESWRVRKYKEINYILKWPDIVKFINHFKMGWTF